MKLGRQDKPVLARPDGVTDEYLRAVESHVADALVVWPNLKQDAKVWGDAMLQARRLFGDLKVSL